MAELFNQLVEDHVSIAKVLDVLEKGYQNYRSTHEAESLELVLQAMEYLVSYAETFHHPLEEKAFDYLQLHQLGNEKIIRAIRNQHEGIEQKTRHVKDLLGQVSRDIAVNAGELDRLMKEFLRIQRHHLETETEKIFTVLQEIDDNAWWDIASCMVIQKDPLHSEDEQRVQFKLLAESIFQTAV